MLALVLGSLGVAMTAAAAAAAAAVAAGTAVETPQAAGATPATAADAPVIIPCTPRKVDEAAPACSRVVIPDGLCAACPLRRVRADGGFVDCHHVYHVRAPACRAKLAEYAAANACDARRGALVAGWDAAPAHAVARLDYFVYSLCELGCDAVPTGATVGEYAARRNATLAGAAGGEDAAGLWNVRRGNAAAHFWYDVCKVFPRLGYFDRPPPHAARQAAAAADADAAGGGGVCGELAEWIESGDARNWAGRDDVNISAAAQTVIDDALWALQAHEEATWRRCVPMETAQGRI